MPEIAEFAFDGQLHLEGCFAPLVQRARSHHPSCRSLRNQQLSLFSNHITSGSALISRNFRSFRQSTHLAPNQPLACSRDQSAAASHTGGSGGASHVHTQAMSRLRSIFLAACLATAALAKKGGGDHKAFDYGAAFNLQADTYTWTFHKGERAEAANWVQSVVYGTAVLCPLFAGCCLARFLLFGDATTESMQCLVRGRWQIKGRKRTAW